MIPPCPTQILPSTAICCTALYCCILHCTAVLHGTVKYCTTLWCTALHCVTLQWDALHCVVPHLTALLCPNATPVLLTFHLSRYNTELPNTLTLPKTITQCTALHWSGQHYKTSQGSQRKVHILAPFEQGCFGLYGVACTVYTGVCTACSVQF